MPPTRWRSMTATFIPAPARRNAKDGPAWPVPMMIASKSGMTSLSSVNEFNQTGSSRSEIVRRPHNAHPAPGVEHEQVIVTADDRLGSGRKCELEVLIVLWITAIADPHGRLKPDGSMAQYFQDPLTPCNRDRTCKPRTVQNPGNLGINRGREREHIDFLGTQQRAFRNAV